MKRGIFVLYSSIVVFNLNYLLYQLLLIANILNSPVERYLVLTFIYEHTQILQPTQLTLIS